MTEKKEVRKKYYGIDWLRVIACFGIVAMHMLKNNQYTITGWGYETVIPSFTDFVHLFMAVSAFGMCCGYYKKVLEGKIDWMQFYKKRYCKILPFFALLICIDVMMGFSKKALSEGIVEMTLLHGFVPDGMEVIGVSWFLGLVFIFYMIFPFFCALLENRKFALIGFVLSIGINYICETYYTMGRSNFLYSFCYFILGGLIYRFKEEIQRIKYYYYVPFLICSIVCYYVIGGNVLTRLWVTATMLMVAITVNVRDVKVISFISGISMEIYLSHMVMFRAIEKLHINTRLGSGWGQYIATVVCVIGGAMIFAVCMQMVFGKIGAIIEKR